MTDISVSVAEAARRTGLTTSRVYDLLNTGAIKGVYDNSKRLVIIKSLENYILGLPTDRDAS